MDNLASILAFVSALGAGLMAGFFYAFSGLVMPALARRPAREAIAAMQTINVVVLNPLFFAMFFGTALTGAALGVLMAVRPPAFESIAAIGAALVYLVGSIGVTIAKNVPLNEELKAASPEAPAAAALWTRYLKVWVFWNTVRTLACAAASAGFMLAL